MRSSTVWCLMTLGRVLRHAWHRQLGGDVSQNATAIPGVPEPQVGCPSERGGEGVRERGGGKSPHERRAWNVGSCLGWAKKQNQKNTQKTQTTKTKREIKTKDIRPPPLPGAFPTCCTDVQWWASMETIRHDRHRLGLPFGWCWAHVDICVGT